MIKFGSCILAVLPAVALAQSGETQVRPNAAAPLPSRGAVAAGPADIVVTALRRSESLQKVPAAISALGASTLQAAGINSPEALAATVPSLQFSSQVNSLTLSIRGVSLDIGTGTGEPTVAPYINGVYISRVTAPLIDFSDLARVEVLRGPQGTLYGRNSTAGAFNFIASAPTDKLEGSGTIGTGSFDRKLVRGTLAGPLAGDAIGFRLSGSYEENDGAVRNLTTGNRVNGSKRTYLHGGIVVRPTGDIENKLDLFYVRENNSGPLEFFLRQTVPGFFEANFPGLPVRIVGDKNDRIYINSRTQTKKDLLLLTNNLSVPLSDDILLKSITGYVKHDLTGYQDADGSDQSITTLGDEVSGPTRNDSREFTQEFNLTGDIGPISFVTGVFYFRERTRPVFPARFPIGLPSLGLPAGTTIIQFANDRTTSRAAFADITWNITDRLRAVGGLRHSEDRKRVVQTQGLFIPGVPANALLACDGQEVRAKFKATTPKAGLQYDAAPGVLTYVQYQRGEKAGTYNLSACGNTVGPEKVVSYEGGIKSRLAPGVTLNVTAFHYDYSDLQVTVSRVISGITSFGLENAAKAKITGVEVETSITSIPRLNISGGVSYLNTKYSEYLDGTGNNFSGNKLSRAPKWSVKPAVEYTLPLSGFVSRASLRGEISYTSRVYYSPSNTKAISQAGIALVNASLNFVSDESGVTLRLFGRNLTDRDVKATVISAPTQGGILAFRGLPRTWGLELSKSF